MSETFRHRECLHSGPISHYCEQCKMAVCGTCALYQHHAHKTTSLKQKGHDAENALNAVLSACQKQEKEIAERTTSLNQCEREIEDCASKEIQKMTERHELVKEAEENIFKEQVSELNQWKDNELQKVQTEKFRLEQLDNN